MKKFCLLAAFLALSLMFPLALVGCSSEATVNDPDSNQPVSTLGNSDIGSAANPIAEAEKPSEAETGKEGDEEMEKAVLLYQGHGSLRITTQEGKVIYIDPYAGEGYDEPADLILVTHPHSDHTAVDLIKTQNPDCQTITYEEALAEGEHKTFELDYITVEAVEAGNNQNHDINVCVGYIITLSNGKSIYVSGDTSTTEQMGTLTERKLDYAFFCCDGKFNMDVEEAGKCAALVQAKHSIPYHMAPGELFNRERAESFEAEGALIIANGEEITIE